MWVAIVVPLVIVAFALVLERVEAWLDRSRAGSSAPVVTHPAAGRLGGPAAARVVDVGPAPIGIDPAPAPTLCGRCSALTDEPVVGSEIVAAGGASAETAGRAASSKVSTSLVGGAAS